MQTEKQDIENAFIDSEPELSEFIELIGILLIS